MGRREEEEDDFTFMDRVSRLKEENDQKVQNFVNKEVDELMNRVDKFKLATPFDDQLEEMSKESTNTPFDEYRVDTPTEFLDETLRPVVNSGDVSDVSFSAKEANKMKAEADRARAEKKRADSRKAEKEKWMKMIEECKVKVKEIRDSGVKAPQPARDDDPFKSQIQNEYAWWKEVLKAHNVAKSATPVSDSKALQEQINKIQESLAANRVGFENLKEKLRVNSLRYKKLTGTEAKNSYGETFKDNSPPRPTSGSIVRSTSSNPFEE